MRGAGRRGQQALLDAHHWGDVPPDVVDGIEFVDDLDVLQFALSK